MDKPYSAACDRNKEFILTELRAVLSPQDQRVLEIGAGTGQHAVFFAEHFPFLEWVVSDKISQHPGIRQWLADSHVPISGPLEYEIGKTEFPPGHFDITFCANVLHIISWQEFVQLAADLGQNLKKSARSVFYWPFFISSQTTAASNLEFDNWLKKNTQSGGIRWLENVVKIMEENNFALVHSEPMPANNQLLVFKKTSNQ